jgi:hypothetical protein
MRLPNFLLCLVIVFFGSIVIKSFTNANSDPVKKVSSDLDFGLSDSDLDKINGIVDEKLDPIREDLRTVERSLSDRIDDLQKKISDCSTRCDAMKINAVAPVVKSGGGSTGNVVANKYETKPAIVKFSGGGSSGSIVQNVYSQPVQHWSYPGDITTHMQVEHGQSVSGMSVEQQLSMHDAIHESQRSNVTRTVTRSNLQTSNCPGGVCPTSSSTVSRSVSSPRLFGRLFGR